MTPKSLVRKGGVVYAALLGLFVLLALAGTGCGSKSEDAANGGTVARPVTTTVPANAPPAAQQAISASEAQGAEMQRRANAQGAAMKAAAQGK